MTEVCVVLERSISSGQKYLFGVYASKAEAVRGYGDPDQMFEAEFVVCKVLTAPPVPVPEPSEGETT